MRRVKYFRRSGTVLLLIPVAAPVWGVGLGFSGLTVGRALILLGAALLALDCFLAPRTAVRLPRVVCLVIAGIAALWLWIVINAETWGCGTCGGDLYGATELAALFALAVLICTLEPKLRFALVLAVVAGGTLEAVLALAGVHGFTSGTMDTSSVQGRLAGTFGNPNELGIALAFSVPAVLAALPVVPRRWRAPLVLALLVISVALVLTLSRSALIAAAAGGAIVLVLLQPAGSLRRRWLLVGFGGGCRRDWHRLSSVRVSA